VFCCARYVRFAFFYWQIWNNKAFGVCFTQTLWNCIRNTRHDTWFYWYNPENNHKFSQWLSSFPHFRRYGCKSVRISRPCGWYFCNVIASVITNVFPKAKRLTNVHAGTLWRVRASTLKTSRIMAKRDRLITVRTSSRPLLCRSSDFYPLKIGYHNYSPGLAPQWYLFFTEKEDAAMMVSLSGCCWYSEKIVDVLHANKKKVICIFFSLNGRNLCILDNPE